jgi:hypothetical protein
VKGDATLGGAVYAASVSVDRKTDLNANVDTTGAQTYKDVLVVGVDATVKGGDLAFAKIQGKTVDGQQLKVEGDGQINFNASVGDVTRLKRLGVENKKTSGGSTTFKGSELKAVTLSVNDLFLLGADVAVTADAVTFDQKIDSESAAAPRSLVVNASASTAFNGAVGSAHKLSSLKTNAAGTTSLKANVTADSVDFGDPVLLGASSTIEAKKLVFEQTLDAPASTVGRDLTLNVGEFLIFGGAVGMGKESALKDLLLTSPAPLNSPNFSIAYAGEGTFDINVLGTFQMGRGQRLINPSGGLNLNAGWKIVLSDIIVNGNLKVDPPGGIFIQGRDPVAGVAGDTGVNLIAKSMSFDNQLQFMAGAPRVVNFETESGQVAGLIEAPGISFFKTAVPGSRDSAFQNYAAGLRSVAGLGSLTSLPAFGGIFVSAGQKFLRAAEALAGALAEQESPELFTETSISAAKIRELEFLGIYARLATKDEQQSITERRGYFSQILHKLEMDPAEYQVVVNRVTQRQVDELLARFDQLFFSRSNGERVDRHAEIQEGFVEAYGAYLATGATSPRGLKTFLAEAALENSKAKQVLFDLQSARNLFQQIDRMGFTPREAQLSKESIILDMGVDVLSPKDLRDLVESQGDVRVLPLEEDPPSSTNIKLPVDGLDLPKTTKKKHGRGVAPEASVKKAAPRISGAKQVSKTAGVGAGLARAN